MKFLTGLLAAVVLIACMGTSHAVVRIADDRGGRIGTYVDKYQGLRTSGETVDVPFPSAGTYPFYCTAHSGSGMFGVVQVR